jgi:hypothetical protein
MQHLCCLPLSPIGVFGYEPEIKEKKNNPIAIFEYRHQAGDF